VYDDMHMHLGLSLMQHYSPICSSICTKSKVLKGRQTTTI